MLLMCGCADHPAVRPDPEPEPPAPVHTVAFATPGADRLLGDADAAAVTVGIDIVRTPAATAPAAVYALAVDATPGFVASCPSEVAMEAAQGHARIALTVDAGAVGPGESRRVVLAFASGTPVTEGAPASAVYTFSRPAAPTQTVAATYRLRGRSVPVQVEVAAHDNTYYYIVRADGFERRIAHTDAGVHLDAGADADGIPYCDMADVADADPRIHPALAMRSNCTEGERRYNLAVARRTEGGAIEADVEYLCLDDAGWADCGSCTFTDGWFLPVVWYQAQYFDPATHPWQVWMQRSTSTPGIYRVIDLYRGGCPLAPANSSQPGTALIIDARNSAGVVIDAQSAGFANPDIFPDGAVIASGAGATFDPQEDGFVISVPEPLRMVDGVLAPNKRALPSIFAVGAGHTDGEMGFFQTKKLK